MTDSTAPRAQSDSRLQALLWTAFNAPNPADRNVAWEHVNFLLQQLAQACLRLPSRRLEDTVDICQSVLSDLQKRGPTDGLLERPSAYLRTALLNKLRSKIRGADPLRRAAHLDPAAPGPFTSDLDRGTGSGSRVRRERIFTEAFLGQLDTVSRTIVDLRCRDVPYPEIAREVGLDEPAVRARFSRAIREARSRVRPQND